MVSRALLFGCYMVALLGTIGCSSTKNFSKHQNQVYNLDFLYDKDQVLILLVDLYPATAELRNANLVQGDFEPMEHTLLQHESVRVQILDQNDHVLVEKLFDHPLIHYKEYDNGSGPKYLRFEEKKGSLLLKSKYSSEFKSLRIDYGTKGKYKLISQIDLALVL